jgi:hypothetical protein
MTEDDGFTDAERRALAALPRETPLPPDLEDRVVDALRARGLVRATSTPAGPPRRGVLRLGLAAAGLFGSGLGAGWLSSRRAAAPPVETGGPLYLLLLYPGSRFEPGTATDEATRVAEYGAWAGRLRRVGQLVGAEKLKPAARLLGADATEARPPGPQGYFLVRARDEAEAEAIARECPHLRHGGRVAVQAVDPT